MSSNSKIIVGVDYGTTSTGVAFAVKSSGEGGWNLDLIKPIANWPSGHGKFKVPSRIAYPQDNPGLGLSAPEWGFNVKPGMTACSWTKLSLDESTDQGWYGDKVLETMGPWESFTSPTFIMERLKQEFQDELDKIPIEFWFRIPAQWPEKAEEASMKAAVRAGFAQHRLVFIREPQAAAGAMFRFFQADFKARDGALVCDCGGGTVDISTYIVLDTNPQLHVNEISSVRGAKCGGTAIDRQYYKLMMERMPDFASLPYGQRSPGSILMEQFEDEKCSFSGMESQNSIGPLPEQGTIALQQRPEISQNLSESDMLALFDPVLQSIIGLINEQINAATRERGHPVINKIVLVGGLSASPYLRDRLVQFFGDHGKFLVAVPPQPERAVAYGAVLCGLQGEQPLFNQCPQHYGFAALQQSCRYTNANHTSFSDQALNGSKKGHECLHWVLQKGKQYTEGYKRERRFAFQYQLGDHPNILFPLSVYSCNLSRAANCVLNNSVLPVGNIILDFGKVNLAGFAHRQLSDPMVYNIEFCIETTLDAAGEALHFCAMALGHKIGELSIRIEHSFPMAR